MELHNPRKGSDALVREVIPKGAGGEGLRGPAGSHPSPTVCVWGWEVERKIILSLSRNLLKSAWAFKDRRQSPSGTCS